MRKIYIILSLLLLLLNMREAHGQTDTEFWFAVPKVTQGHRWDGRKFVFRFANLNLDNQITISMPANPGFTPIVVDLLPNEASSVDVTTQILDLWTEDPDKIYNRGIKIKATNFTTAYFEVGTIYNPDIFALKGRNALGKDFYVPFQDHFNNGNYSPQPYSGIYIVATQDQTTITVTPTQPVFPGRPAGVPFDTILNMGQTIAFVPDNYSTTGQAAGNHLGGTRVQSDKPIAISTSDDSVAANPYGGCRDLIGDQIIPTNIIGTEYIAMKGRLTIREFLYILATQPNTQVYIDGTLEAIIQPGEQIRWEFTQQNHHIKTSEPTYVYHVAGFGCEMGGAVLPPINVCTGSTKVSFTRSKGESFFLNILVRAGAEDGFIFNGDGPNTIIKASDFVTVPGTTDWLAAEYEMNQTQVPIGLASLIENSKDVFHLGIINGGPASGTMYGYFSDFNELDLRANISGTGAMHKACFGDPVQLVAQGGVKYQWSPPDYLDDPTSATPIAIPEESIKYTVTVSGACKTTDSTSVYISLYGPANAAFTIDQSEGCSPFDLHVVNQSYGISNYSWRMGDNTVYTTEADEFYHTYVNTTTEPIIRELMLVGRYSMCRDTMTTNITVYPEIKADAKADIISGCAPLKVNFENLSSGADQFEWKFGDGSTSNKKNPIHEFQNFSNKDTVYTVVLDAYAKTGCTSQKTIQIHVKPYIETGFIFDPPVHCSPYPAELSNTSFGATYNHWSFDGGASFDTLQQQQFMHTFENNDLLPDTVNIWLIGENDSGCRDTLIRPVTIYPAIKAEFTADVLEGCNPLPVQFSNTSTGAKTYEWDFDNHEGSSSESNPLIWFDNPDFSDTLLFDVKLIATSDYLCKAEVTKHIKVYPKIEAEFTFDYTSFCTPQRVTFQNHSRGAGTYLWDFGDGYTSDDAADELSHQYTNLTGNDKIYPVNLIIENESGCKDTLTRSVTIYPDIKADFSFTTSGCHPLEVSFENNSLGAEKYLWTFGDGGSTQVAEPSKTYTNTSHLENEVYQIELIAESQFGCKDTLLQEITVHPKPHASFSVSSAFGCAPLYVDLIENSTGATKFNWNLGDGSHDASSTGSIAHTYFNDSDTSIIYITRLIAENEYGCTDTLYRGTEVFPDVKAQITLSEITGCHPLDLEVLNDSHGADGTTPYQWNFGDGTSSTSQQSYQQHRFNNFSNTQAKEYTIRLKAESQYGCKDSTQTKVTVFPNPGAAFEPTVTQGCSPLSVEFDDTSIGAGQYAWDFGDGSTSNQAGNNEHIFTQAHDLGIGIFPITLLIENTFGCFDSTQRQINVYPEITADFESTTEGCHPLSVNFNNLSLGTNTIHWSFGDGSTSSLQDPAYIFTNESHTEIKHYDVQLHTSSVYGCEANISKQFTVYPKPTSAFTVSVDEGCAPLPAIINNLSSGGSMYEWDLGSGTSSVAQHQFNHTFNNYQDTPQNHQLRLKSINEYGCFRESSQQVLVYPEVEAGFNADNEQMMGCNPLDLEFINNSLRAHQYYWDFGDGNTSTIKQPANKFFTPGTQESIYDIKLSAQSVYGCRDSIIRQAKVFPVPMADFFVSPHTQVFPSKSIRMENLSAPGNWTFYWDMGDGTTLTTDNWNTMEHEFVWPSGDYSTRYYTISLKTANDFCHDSISQNIVVKAPMPMVGFEPAAQGCPPLEIQFRNDSQYGKEFYWDFDDGEFSQQQNPVHTFHEPGEYMIKLLVSGEGGIDSAYQTVTVFEPPKADFRVTPPVVQLPYESVQMVNLSSLAAYYEWHMGDGTIYYDFEPNHKYDQPGNYEIRLNIATNTFPQCFDQIVKANAVIAEQGCQVIFPDAFTPNTSGPSDGRYVTNDPANHVFYPIHTGVQKYQLEIFNRWGEFLFRSTDIDIGWDGYYRGKLSPMDVYVWKLKATCHSGKEIESAGDVTLYR